jgi:hypothetical protein
MVKMKTFETATTRSLLFLRLGDTLGIGGSIMGRIRSRGGAPVPTGDWCRGTGMVIDPGPIDLPGRHVGCNALTADSGTIIDTYGSASLAIDAIIDGYGGLCVDGAGTLALTAPNPDGGLTHLEAVTRKRSKTP